MDFSPESLSAADNGWEKKEGRLLAIMLDQLPAPEYSIEMSSCKCKKTKCIKGKFKNEVYFGNSNYKKFKAWLVVL